MAKVLYEIRLWPSADFTPASGNNVLAKCVFANNSLDGIISEASKKFNITADGCAVLSLSGAVIDEDEVLRYLISNGTTAFYLRPNFNSVITTKSNTLKSCQGLSEETRPNGILAIQFGSFGEENGLNSNQSNTLNNSLHDITERDVQLHENTETDVNLQLATSKPTFCVSEHEILEMGEVVEKEFNEDGSLLVQSENFYHVPNIVRIIRSKIAGSKPEELMRAVKNSKVCGNNEYKLILHAAGIWLMTNCKERNKVFYPTKAELLVMAKSIVHYFPSMSNFSSPDRPWDVIYNEKNNVGVLELYIRQKRSRDRCKIEKQQLEIEPATKRQRLMLPTVTYSEEEVQEAEKFMRHNPVDVSNSAVMLHKFKITREQRRKLVESKNSTTSLVLQKYPLLLNLKEAVEDEFKTITSKSFSNFTMNWNKFRAAIPAVAAKKVKSNRAVKLINATNEYANQFDTEKENKCILELLLHLLPNTNRKTMVRKSSTLDCLSLIYNKFEEGTTMRQAISESSDMIQPGILHIGKEYFIKIEESFMHLPNSMLDLAIAYVVGFYYCLGIVYPVPLKFVFLFFESLFEICLSSPSVVVTNLKSMLVAQLNDK